MAEALRSDPIFWIFAAFSFSLGACVASFLNVVIWRVPRGESIVSPPSHCPKCGAAIRWWQNVPIASWLALRGRCANCRAPISPRYIMVEALGGALFLAAFIRFNPLAFCFCAPAAVTLAVMWTWLALMIVGTFIDFDHQLLPDFVTVGGMALGIVHSVAKSIWAVTIAKSICVADFAPVFWSAGGMAFGLGLLWLVRFFGSKAFGREAMGMGDVLLMGAVGALFGPVAVLFTLVLSSVFGSLAGVGMMLAAKARLGRLVAIPYGPYICAGCLAWMLYGPELVVAYTRLARLG